jgi:hypothetical protein
VHAQVEAGGAVFAGWARQESPAQPADETVRFCEMRHGDRIDHGLALGIAPAKWVGRHGDMILPVDEHLDNLVWAWHHACDMSAGSHDFFRTLPRTKRASLPRLRISIQPGSYAATATTRS